MLAETFIGCCFRIIVSAGVFNGEAFAGTSISTDAVGHFKALLAL
jgi:hypothetical protein